MTLYQVRQEVKKKMFLNVYAKTFKLSRYVKIKSLLQLVLSRSNAFVLNLNLLYSTFKLNIFMSAFIETE